MYSSVKENHISVLIVVAKIYVECRCDGMKEGWYLDFLKETIHDFLSKASINSRHEEAILYYFINSLLSKNLLKAEPKPNEAAIRNYLKNYLKDILEFYTDKDNYLNHKSRELFRELYNMQYGSFLWSILEYEEHFEILFYTGLTSDPYLYAPRRLFIPKLSEKEVTALMEVVR